MKPKVYIRADGNSEIGMGHVIRSMALGHMLSKHFSCFIYTRFVNEFVLNQSRACNITVCLIKSSENHYEEFLSSLKGDEIVILDNYFFDSAFQLKIKEIGCKLACIDDIHSIHYYADIIINHSPASSKLDYSCEPYTRLLLGLDYLLLREPFLTKAKSGLKRRNKIEKVLICFGGSDNNNLTEKFTKEVIEKTDLNVVAVVGPVYKHLSSLSSFASTNRVLIKKNLDQNEMISLIETVDVAIVPSSSILFEVMALQKMFVTGYFVENQKNIYTYFASLDKNIALGNFKNATLSLKLNALTSINWMKFDDLIDGRSGERLLNEFRKL